jgi:UDP-glucose 4-epimerase
MKILITGVAGLIGSRLADWIIKNTGNEVIGIDDMSGGYESNVPPMVNLYKRDLGVENISDIFEEHEPDIVYHLAAYAAEGLSPFIRKFNYENNLIATARIINECVKHNVSRLIFTSSMGVYGHGDGNPPFDEKLAPQPIDPYGIAKYACEMDVAIAGEQHGLDWCIVRPHNFYGANQNIWDKYRNVLGIWMYQIMNDIRPTIFGDGEQVRAFSYIDDSLEPFWNASQNDDCIGEIINLGGIKEYTINEACNILLDITETDLKPSYSEQRHEVKHAFPTYQKSVDLLRFEHKIDLKEGLTKMWEWARVQPNRDRFVWSKFELDRGIYKFWK